MPVDVGFHWSMLNDYDRNVAYRSAIRRVASGRIVYDLGAGAGPMSYYALTAGARRVYGFEIDRAIYPYLRQLARTFPQFTPLRTDVLRGRLPRDTPDVIVCEMWSSWLTDWPMVKALTRILRRSARVHVIPTRGYHVVQLVQARHRARLPIQFAAGAGASVFSEPVATADMSLPALACVTDFQEPVRPIDVAVTLVPLTSGTVNAVRLYSYEEVSSGYILPRIGTRGEELLRWVTPTQVRGGRSVRLRICHAWDADLRLRLE